MSIFDVCFCAVDKWVVVMGSKKLGISCYMSGYQYGLYVIIVNKWKKIGVFFFRWKSL